MAAMFRAMNGAAARAVAVQGVGYQFFAGTGLAIDQHGDVGVAEAANGAEHLLHRRGFTDDLRRARQALWHVQPLLLLGVLVGPLDQRNRLVHVERRADTQRRLGTMPRRCPGRNGRS